MKFEYCPNFMTANFPFYSASFQKYPPCGLDEERENIPDPLKTFIIKRRQDNLRHGVALLDTPNRRSIASRIKYPPNI